MVERREDDHRASDRARAELSESTPLSRLVVFKNKLPSLKAGEWGVIVSWKGSEYPETGFPQYREIYPCV
jgi:hypothetical protein